MSTQYRWHRNPVQWWRAAKRRTPGVYVFRTRRHHNPQRTEWGYVGKSLHLAARKRDHEGTGRYKHAAKDWVDLVHSYWALRLPWWLGWDPVILALEAVAIVLLRPRYNDRGNPRRSKVRKVLQKVQRLERDARPADWRPALFHTINWPLAGLGICMALAGLAGWMATR